MKSKILAKYLANNSTPDETAAVEQWLAESKKNEKLMKDFKQIWDISEEYQMPEGDFDVELDWAVLQSRIESDNADRHGKMLKSKSIFSPSSNLSMFVRMAAIFLIAVCLGIYISQKNFIEAPPELEPVLKEISMSKGQRGSFTLSDGTKVFINGDSKIKLPPTFKAEVREVYLEGEAYFDVAKNPNKPFLIHTRGTIVQVLGTSFSIRSFPEDKAIQTVVKEGVVSFRSEKESIEKGVILTAGKLGRFDLDDKTIATKDIENLDVYLSWKDGYLTFQNATMKEVKGQLERKYDIDVKFSSDKIEELLLTAELKSRSLNNVLETICVSLDLQYTLNKDTVDFKLAKN